LVKNFEVKLVNTEEIKETLLKITFNFRENKISCKESKEIKVKCGVKPVYMYL
jgi:predicted transcriptional regulator